MRRLHVFAIMLLPVTHGVAHAAEKFERTAVHFERNATDNDAEVLFEAIGRGTGLATLKVTAPDGRTVIDYKAPDSKLGLQRIVLESPEPKDDASIKADFPEGEYTFSARTTTGVELLGKPRLSHSLPNVVRNVRPRAGQTGVALKGLRIEWDAASNSAGYVVTVEQEEMDLKITAKLPPTTTSFAVADGFLQAGTEYKLAVGSLSRAGNASFIESEFKTAGK